MRVPPIPRSAMGGPPIHLRGSPGAAHVAELCLVALLLLRLEGRRPVRTSRSPGDDSVAERVDGSGSAEVDALVDALGNQPGNGAERILVDGGRCRVVVPRLVARVSGRAACTGTSWCAEAPVASGTV